MSLPGPPTHVEQWPFWLYSKFSGHYFTYFWGVYLLTNCCVSLCLRLISAHEVEHSQRKGFAGLGDWDCFVSPLLVEFLE